jgi:hypothetical protein
MNEIQFAYSICSELPASPEGPASLGTKFADTLDALGQVDPMIFTN